LANALLHFTKCSKNFQPKKLIYHISFFFDNLFTNQTLLRFLSENGYNGTGTIHINRLPKNIKLMEKTAWKKKIEELLNIYWTKIMEFIIQDG